MTISASPIHRHSDDRDYGAYMLRLQSRFFGAVSPTDAKLFTTKLGDNELFDAYLQAFPESERQHHNCHACRRFINSFGALVAVKDNGDAVSPMWNEDDAPDEYKASVRAMLRTLRGAVVNGVFASNERVWGQPITGDWAHFAVTPPAKMVHADVTKTAGQAMAEKLEEIGMVRRALADFTEATVDQALTLLKSDTMYRSEKVVGVAEWLSGLHKVQSMAKGPRRNNLTWRSVALAPAGFSHVRSSMIGTLLEDIAAGLPFDDVSRKFKAKMHPLAYQRPQAAPTAGNVAQAEKLFAQLDLAPALERRIARLDEIPKVWEPKMAAPAKAADGSVFGHLARKGEAAAPSMQIPPITLTLEKFVRTVMPTAEALDVWLDTNIAAIAITTAVHAEAPKLFQWEHSFAHYCWTGGSMPRQYGLQTGWVKSSGITRLPSRWDDPEGKFTHRGDGIILLLDGARETRQASAALFPELLRSELHGVRSTIEAHSRSAKMQGLGDGSAIGLDLRQGQSGRFPVNVRVTAAGRTQAYKIDRWD